MLEAWFEFAAPDFSPKTVKETRGYIDRSLMPALGSRPLAKLKPADLDAFYRRLLASGGSGGRPLTPGTVRRIHGILRGSLNQGVKWGWIGINPATATTPPRVPVSDIKPPSAEALGRVLRRAEAESPDLARYLMLADAIGGRLEPNRHDGTNGREGDGLGRAAERGLFAAAVVDSFQVTILMRSSLRGCQR